MPSEAVAQTDVGPYRRQLDRSILRSVLSFSGRIDRKTWWLTQLGLPIAFLILFWLLAVIDSLFLGGILTNDTTSIGENQDQYAGLLVLLFTGYLYASTTTNVRRLHDRGRSGFFLFLGYIPILGWIWLYIEMGFLRGQSQVNRFGDVPGAILVDHDVPLNSNNEFSTSMSTTVR